ncbi:MAG: multicopper oxidase family protein [Gemmatimonadetes bacterium]|nr:multicopper oxidase family protein [Gemmatimonadota bacterium]
MDRREFLRIAGASGGLAAAGTTGLLAACHTNGAGFVRSDGSVNGWLYRPTTASPNSLTLTAHQATVEIAPGVHSPVLTWGTGPIGPTIEARTGQRATITMRNELTEPTIAHWHGLRPPEAADGHPRLAVGSGQSYEYDFEIEERAGLYWYHSHAHNRTAPQVYLGLAGLFIIRDDAEDALSLPNDRRELSLVLQDKRQDSSGKLVYDPFGPQLMEGFLADTPFVNGIRFPRVEVDSALYRIRVLSASNARIFRVGLSNGSPLVLIGVDGGLLDIPAQLRHIDIGTGERADLLVDFSGLPAGTIVRLQSQEFPSPTRAMGMMMGGGRQGMGGAALPQGSQMDLLEFIVSREVRESRQIPKTLVPLVRLDRAEASRERVFRFNSMMMSHTVNSRSFDMSRVDERVPFGATEVWRFVNDSPFPHPIHMHAVHFQVLTRTGGRGEVFAWERGWKDTVLVFPGEEVEVIACFDRHRGMFLLHCHNLEHEDAGMMMNFVIE